MATSSSGEFTPPPGEPFAEAAAEAMQAAVMSVRLILAIADAVRRHRQQQEKGDAAPLPPAEEATRGAQPEAKNFLPADIADVLMRSADWPLMAQQLMALKQAGVDLEQLLPRVGEIAVTVRDQVAENAARVAREGTREWETALRETLPAGLVREAILSSPAWPEIAATMSALDARGVDVRRILASAHDEGVGVDRAIAKVLGAGEVPVASRDAMLSWGPMSRGLDLPADIQWKDREKAFKQLSIGPGENGRAMRLVRDALPGREREADLMIAAEKWPMVALRITTMEREGKPVAEHLAGLMKDTSWDREPGRVGTRLLQAASHVLQHPPGEAPPLDRPRVSAASARSTSTTMDPTKASAAKGAAPAERGVAAHREAAPAAKARRAK
ncbi:hypothetical protein ACF09E_34810 [Streptomyces sp. NPDC014891]|uniref:hypothetical protein n=1 Tax=Streptomyces sp. NPDC014891 TaxID=3364929 RepID=UPI0036FA0AAD